MVNDTWGIEGDVFWIRDEESILYFRISAIVCIEVRDSVYDFWTPENTLGYTIRDAEAGEALLKKWTGWT